MGWTPSRLWNYWSRSDGLSRWVHESPDAGHIDEGGLTVRNRKSMGHGRVGLFPRQLRLSNPWPMQITHGSDPQFTVGRRRGEARFKCWQNEPKRLIVGPTQHKVGLNTWEQTCCGITVILSSAPTKSLSPFCGSPNALLSAYPHMN